MNELTMQAAPPADREVEVTATLTFKESDLRLWENECSLASHIARSFELAIVQGDALDAYEALKRL